MSTVAAAQIEGTYVLDPFHSSFGFAIEHNGVYRFRGRFREVEASLADGVLTGVAQVSSIETGIPPLEEHLRSPNFFDVERTSTIAFRSTAIAVAEDGRAEVDGELTMLGITRPLVATGTFARGESLKGDEVVGFELGATIDRRDFGLDWQAPLPNGGDVIGWDVCLEIQLHMVRP
jgi:polyisoprenoid-binding protein YceI